MRNYMQTLLGTVKFSRSPLINGHPLIVSREVEYAENGAGVYTGSVTVPAGATVLDIQLRSTVLWAAATSAVMKVGDAADDDGWYTGVNLKATDLLVGEVIRFASPGGKEGAYLVTASGLLNTSYSGAARVISGVITSVGAGTAGRTRMLVTYALPHPFGAVQATKA